MTHVYPTHHKNHQISIRPVSSDCYACGVAYYADYHDLFGFDEGRHE